MANCLAFEVYTGDGRAGYVFLDKLTTPFSPTPEAITCVKVKAAENAHAATTAMTDSAAVSHMIHPSLRSLLHGGAASPGVVAALEDGEELTSTLQEGTTPASLFTWSPTLGFLVNHACASGNLCMGVCG